MRYPTLQPWHSTGLEAVFDHLQAAPTGLTTADAQQRFEAVGANVLPRQSPPSRWQILLRQFRSPLIYILGLAACVSAVIGDVKDAGFIIAVLAINAAIGSYQEWRAEQSSRALQHLLKIRASVMRDGEVCEIDAEAIVPGDIVWLESGNRVPADLRLMQTHNLEVDESLLTGESLTVLKQATWLGDTATPLADRLNMMYAGSIVARGRGRGMVVATGTGTAVGQLALDMMATVGGTPPLLKRMERFSQVIALGVVVVAISIALLGIFTQGYRPGRDVYVCRCPGGFGNSRRTASGADSDIGDCHASHGSARGDCAPFARRGRAGQLYPDRQR
jgi:Ca2+-transporting ATPase